VARQQVVKLDVVRYGVKMNVVGKINDNRPLRGIRLAELNGCRPVKLERSCFPEYSDLWMSGPWSPVA
jgi:hypothetical protein